MMFQRLSSTEAAELAQCISTLAHSGLPLAPGLRAAADDADSVRLAGVLRMIADELDRGAPLAQALGPVDRHLPAYVQGTIRAGLRSGALAEVLVRLVEADRATRQLRREIRLAVAYPLILIVMIFALLAFITLVILPQFRVMFTDFDVTIPPLTAMLLNISDLAQQLWRQPLLRIASYVAVFVIVGCIVAKLVEWLGWKLLPASIARNAVQLLAPVNAFAGWLFAWPLRILSTAPLVGPLYLWQAMAEWSRLVALLVDARVPLAEAIELASQGVRSACVARAMRPLADGVRQGHSLGQLIEHSFWLPASLGPLVEWGQKSGQLAAALRTAAEMFDGRIRLRATLLKQIMPPVMFLVVASCLGIVVAALFGPLITLIRTFS